MSVNLLPREQCGGSDREAVNSSGKRLGKAERE